MLFVILPLPPPAQADEAWQADDRGYTGTVQPFLNQYCLDCHGPKKDKADFRVDSHVPNDFLNPAAAAKWAEVVDVLNSHEMPPEDEAQPSVEQTAQVVDWIVAQAVRAEKSRRRNQVVLRRLNRAEYQNTIRDLIGVDFEADAFPEDAAAGGFDNIGAALTLSPLHMELYLNAAEQILARALVEGDQPETIRWRFNPEVGPADRRRIELPPRQRPLVNGGKNETMGDFIVLRNTSWDRNIGARDFAVPVAGDYTLRIRVAGRVPNREAVVAAARKHIEERARKEAEKNPKRPYNQDEVEKKLDHFRQHRMYDYGPPRVKLSVKQGGQPKYVKYFDVPRTPNDPQVIAFRFRLTTEKMGIRYSIAYDIPKELENFWFQRNDDFARPEALIDWFEIEGPLHDTWPPESHTRLLPASPLRTSDERAYAAFVLKKFMPWAWRRPVSDEEVEEKTKLFDQVRPHRDSFVQAIKMPLVAVLTSPHFIYQAIESGRDELNHFELATRLSYFLWSSMPDLELLLAAGRGDLRDAAKLRIQIDRMLKDPRSQALADNFAALWLGLREVGANPPAPDLYRRYDQHLQDSMIEETKAFFNEILHHDLDVRHFIKSDFVTINERLARFYEIPGVRGDEMRRVNAPPDSHRGGLITQGSMLTITSNGTRTSPVKRGTWVMKNILGMDPGLPVANAGEIAPKVPGIDKATVRQRLEIHRELPQCARCHARIDPLGLALENFDASGFWREQEGFGYKGRIGRDDPVIDASAQLPDGTAFNGPDEMRELLLTKDHLFFGCLTEKLFSYALGREATLADQPFLKQAATHLARESTLRSLIEYLVLSEAFSRK